jgi:N-acetylneuraminic acid mutarotase
MLVGSAALALASAITPMPAQNSIDDGSALVQHNTWSLGAPMPTPRMGAFTGAIGSKIYVVGGENNSNVLSVNEIYDTTTNKWLPDGAPMPTPRWLGASAVVKGILYAMGGGVANGGTNVVEAYNPKTNQWSEKQMMPSLGGNIYAAVEKDIIYVIGGYSNGESLGAVWAYNPATDSWVQEASLIEAKRLSAVALLESTIVAAGGLSNEGVTSDNEGYSAKTNKWKELAPMTTASQGPCFGGFTGLLYVAGGLGTGGNGDPLSTLQAYSLKTNAWTTDLASMPDAATNLGSAEVKGRLYCFGGSNNGNPFQGNIFNYVQIYQP